MTPGSPLGIPPYNPQITSYGATRAWAGSKIKFLINAFWQARAILPMLQNVVFWRPYLFDVRLCVAMAFSRGMAYLGPDKDLILLGDLLRLSFLRFLKYHWPICGWRRRTGIENLSFCNQRVLLSMLFDALCIEMQGMCWMVAAFVMGIYEQGWVLLWFRAFSGH